MSSHSSRRIVSMGATRAAQLRGLRYTSLVNRAGALHLASNCQTRSLASVSDAQEGGAPVEQPLKGVKVLELGQLIAGPFCGQLLGHFGAEVIKVEPPGKGDPLRVWRELDIDGVSPWFRSLGRNKKSVTIDMRKPEGRELVKKLAAQSDVLLENFKPGTIERWGLGPNDLHPLNPSLIFTRVSGYGQNGPMSSNGGYASVCEAFGGFRYVNGQNDPQTGLPSGAPVRPNISLGDSLAGLHAAFGTVLALLARGKAKSSGTRTGQTVDVAIYESIMNMMEGTIPEYDRKGVVRQPSGSSVTGIVPTNAYVTKDPSVYIIIGANGDSIYQRLMDKIGRSDLTGPGYEINSDRVRNQRVIEDAITAWTSKHDADELLKALEEARVPAGRIMNTENIMQDPHVQARGMVESVPVHSTKLNQSWDVKMPGVSPILEFNGKTKWAGPDLGEHNDEVFTSQLGLKEADLTRLREEGVI